MEAKTLRATVRKTMEWNVTKFSRAGWDGIKWNEPSLIGV